ncbi:DUF4245 domain-containing protein [Mangrovihabitans endophyticus]|uniref:DUF4245 domain-containing protein n=1 Tax=Mangrovihabitans endophyticus TaxID=1751298 RepID=A0A8J3C2K2_9ACTN|nr:DUF4245 domain-containing protein [Mangrovihabitans endophyticus]GGL08446.1 hypothetical protein GCM10012284_48760 [Mangrovihabitans endophyticus]
METAATPRRREGRTPRDMILSLAVLLVPIALMVLFYRGVLAGDSPVSVDAAPALDSARAAHAFEVAAPSGLGDDWHVTAATFRHASDGATLRLGYVDPGGDAVQLVESSIPAEVLLPAELGEQAKPRGTVRTDTQAWRLYDARQGEQALVLTDGGRSIVIIGTAEAGQLRTLAAALP